MQQNWRELDKFVTLTHRFYIHCRYNFFYTSCITYSRHKIHVYEKYIHCSIYIISERAKRASSVMFVFNRNFSVYIYGRTSSYMGMPNSSLLGNEICAAR